MTTQEFLPYLKCVGTGTKRNRDLTKDEMTLVMRAFLKQEVSQEQMAAFMLGWRVKGESLDEFSASIEVFDEFIKYEPLANSIEFGYPYDGKVKNPYIFSLVAPYLKPYNINLSLHGDLLQPAKNGTTLKEICDNTTLDENAHYYDRSEYFKELHHFSKVRANLGLRSSFNTIEKLLNITKSKTAIIGAFHKPFVEKYITLFQDRYEKLIIVRGNEGTPEIFSKTSITIVENSQIKEIKVDPKEYGIEYKKSTKRISLEESLELIANPSEELKKLVLLNASVILFMYGEFNSIKEAFEKLNSTKV
jgi:anthranilate phosphoribosyltransferase